MSHENACLSKLRQDLGKPLEVFSWIHYRNIQFNWDLYLCLLGLVLVLISLKMCQSYTVHSKRKHYKTNICQSNEITNLEVEIFYGLS